MKRVLFDWNRVVADQIVVEDEAAEAVVDFVEGDACRFGAGEEDAIPLVGERRMGVACQIGHDGILLHIQVLFTFGIGLVFGLAKYFIKQYKYLGLAFAHGLYDFLNVVVTMFVI